MDINVTKRNGSIEKFNPDKIHKVVEWAIEGLSGVSLSDVIVNARIKFYDNISSSDIHGTLVRSAVDLISLENSNYQYVASRLLLFGLRKSVWGSETPPSFLEFVTDAVKKYNVYDPLLLEKYSVEEISLCGSKIDHDRDYLFTHAGLQQLCDKYLIKDRRVNKIHETPQLAFMALSMCAFQNYPIKNRLDYVFRCYDYISKFKINLATPIMAGLRTVIRQYSSCTLIDVDDSMESIFSSVSAVGYYTARRAGIGLNLGRIRPINSTIRNGEVVHTGVIPFLKVFQSTVKSCSQNGLRGGGATVNFPWWHYEIEDILVLKNNAGTDENRVRQLDYVIGCSKLFYQRFLENKEVTLFSPHEAIGLYDAFGTPEFDALYLKYEKDESLTFRKKVSARTLMSSLATERIETGRIYILNVDHVNTHGAWKDTVKMTNLCVEINHPTKPLTHIDDADAEIGVCILSAVNLLEIKNDKEYEKVCDIIVRILDEIIDIQEYTVKAAENFTKNRRSLAVGITNLAAVLAKANLRYSSTESPNFVDEIMEKHQFYLLKASINLAKEKGACAKFNRTKYSDGILPIDTYNKNVDSVVSRKPVQDWEWIRAEISKHGLRHSTLSALMPCESSSVIQNSTNGPEGIRSLLTTKKSKANVLKWLAPHASYYQNRYELVFDFKDNIGYTNICAAIQKWTDMSISQFMYYNYTHYPDKQVSVDKVIREILYAYKMGIKSLYYSLTDDGDRQDSEEQADESGCASGACAL